MAEPRRPQEGILRRLFGRGFKPKGDETSARRTMEPTEQGMRGGLRGEGGGIYGSESDYSDFLSPGGASRERDVNYSPLPKQPAVRDPERPEATLTPADLLDPDPPSVEAMLQRHKLKEATVVDFVLAQFKRSAERRYLLERDWALSIAYYEGRQWLMFDDNTSKIVNLLSDEDPTRFQTINLLRMLTDKVASLATTTEPDANCVPLTAAPIDQQAAKVGRAIGGYCDRKFDRTRQTFDAVQWALATGVGFRKIVWDGKAEALIPKGLKSVPGPDGQPTLGLDGAEVAPVGDIDEAAVATFEMFLDPAAYRWEDVRWLCHAKNRSITYFQEKYPERGFDVSPESIEGGGAGRGWADSYLNGGAGYLGAAAPSPTQMTQGRSSVGQPLTAVCYEYWELPTPRFPEGRLIVVAGRKLLHYGAWPYADRDRFPFTPTYYRRASDSPYGLSLVKDLVPLQMEYNRIHSRSLEQMEKVFDYAVIEAGSDVDVQNFLEGNKRTIRPIPVKKGTQIVPTINRAPGISQENFLLMQEVRERMQDIAGVHDVSKGTTPSGVTAGISIELLQQSDQSQLKPFVTEIENAAVDIKEAELSLFREFASVPRLMGLDESGNPEEALTSVQTFDALTKGGQTRVIVVPGSAMPRTPAGKKQEVLEYYNLGLFGPVGSGPAALATLKLLEFSQPDVVIEAWERIQQAQAQEAQMAAQQEAEMAKAQEEAKAQAAMHGAQLKAENDLQLGQMKLQADLQNAQMQGQNDLAIKQQQMEMDDQRERDMVGVDVEGKMAFDTHATDEDIRFEEAKALIGVQSEELKMQAGLIPTPEQEFAMRQAEQEQSAAQGEKQADKQFGREKEKMKMQSGLKQQEIKTTAKFRPKPAGPTRKPASGSRR